MRGGIVIQEDLSHVNREALDPILGLLFAIATAESLNARNVIRNTDVL